MGQNMTAPVILTGPTGATSWAKVGSSTTSEADMYAESWSFNHTVSSGTDILIVGVCTYDAGSVITVTWNGIPLTKAIDSYDEWLESYRTQIWYLASPATGTYPISLSFSEQITDLVAGASGFSGIATTSPVRDTGINGGISISPSVSVDGAQAGDLIYGVVVHGSATLSTADTEDWEEYHDADNLTGGAARKLATGAAMTINWTSGNTDWYAVCVAFKLQ